MYISAVGTGCNRPYTPPKSGATLAAKMVAKNRKFDYKQMYKKNSKQIVIMLNVVDYVLAGLEIWYI